MSKKNNVHPDHYKSKGRLRQGEDVVQGQEKQLFTTTRRRRGGRRKST